MPPGHDRITIVYDAKDAGVRQLDMAFCKELIPILCSQFPGRLSRVLVINSHWSVHSCWSCISALLPPDTRDRVFFCQRGIPEALSILPGHPYLLHALNVQEALRQRGVAAAAKLQLPPRTPYVPRWPEAFKTSDAASSKHFTASHDDLQEEDDIDCPAIASV